MFKHLKKMNVNAILLDKNCRKGKPIPGFAREVILKVAEMCEVESKSRCKYHLNSPTKRAAMYTGVSERTIQRIRNEEKKKKSGDGKIEKEYPDEDSNYNTMKRISKKGQTIPLSARNIIAKVIVACDEEHKTGEFLVPLTYKSKRTALYTGVSQRTVQRIRHEDVKRNKINQDKILITPGKSRKRTTFIDNIDEFDFQSIRNLIYDLLLIKKVSLTCTGLHSMIKEQHHFSYSDETLYRLLRSKGFEWRKGVKGKRILIEKPEIFKGRLKYLKKIKKLETLGLCIIYLDEWVGDNQKIVNSNVDFNMRNEKYRTKRMVLFHEFSALGFMRRVEKLFKTNEVSNKPDKTLVENWLKHKILPKIPHNSIIILTSNAQSAKNIPNEFSKKTYLIKFLNEKHLSYNPTQTTPELYKIIEDYLKHIKHHTECEDIASIIKNHGFQVLRLPAYMSEFSPIELVWADMKRYIRENSPAGKITVNDVQKITLQAVECFQDKIHDYIRHVIEMENYFLERESLMNEHYHNVHNATKIPPSKHFNSNSDRQNVIIPNNLHNNTDNRDILSDFLPDVQMNYSENIAVPVLNIEKEDDIDQAGPSYLDL